MKNREKSLIYVVDNDAIVATTTAQILRQKGYDAIAFTRTAEALDAARSEMPDLLIADVMMPELSGAELAQHLQWSHPGCRVLLFAGEWDRADAELAAHEDGLEYQLVPKPVHPLELLRTVRDILAKPDGSSADGEARARLRTMENMKESIAAVQADIDTAMARKRSLRRRVGQPRQESNAG